MNCRHNLGAILLLCIVHISFLTCLSRNNEYPIAKTKYGLVRGKILLSEHHKRFDAFRGIPYAKPPVGNLRFRAPVEPESWNTILDTTQEGPYCIQKDTLFFRDPKIEGQEDCLYLNVYVPHGCKKRKLPVMFWIPWGGFIAGRGTSDIAGPEYLMDEDVILVSFNYRLGALGFLTTGDDNAPGNYALKDSVFALKWVQENIENFGGDKDQVTIFGQSAGSAVVHHLLLSPLAKGLFKRAISQSGVALDIWAKPSNEVQQLNVTARQASYVGCGDEVGDNAAVIECLRKVDAKTLVNSLDKFRYFFTEPTTPYTAVVETKTDANPNPFYTKTPLEYVQAGEFENVPWIIGNVQDELMFKAEPILRIKSVRDEMNANFDKLLPKMLLLSASVGEDYTQLYDDIKKHYLFGKNFVDVNDAESVQGFIDMLSDRLFKYGSYQAAMLHSAKGHKNIWFYNFDYKGEYEFGDLFATTNATIDFKWGVCHCDDLLYLFRSPALFSDLKRRNDKLLRRFMVKTWTTFAKLGNPDPKNKLHWHPLKIKGISEMKNENFAFLNMTGNVNTDFKTIFQTGCYIPDRMKFWANQNLAENFPGLQ